MRKLFIIIMLGVVACWGIAQGLKLLPLPLAQLLFFLLMVCALFALWRVIVNKKNWP